MKCRQSYYDESTNRVWKCQLLDGHKGNHKDEFVWSRLDK